MNILLSNDDGIEGKGIQVLAEVLEKDGHNVYVVAPLYERSAASHSITIREPLRVKQISEKSWAVSGTPVDCVLVAFEHILKDKKIDLVISGINAGQNIGDDVLYSGTVGVAIEAMCLGYKAIAISITSYENQIFETAANILEKLIASDISKLIGYRQIININIPNLPIEKIKGYKVCKTGFRRYQNIIHCHKDHRNREIFWIGGDTPVWDHFHENVDGAAIEDHYVSVSPLKIDLNDYEQHDIYQDFFEQNHDHLKLNN